MSTNRGISQNPLQWSNFVCNSFSGTTTFVTFTLTFQTNELTHQQKYSKRQYMVYELIRLLHEQDGLGYRRISYKLNSWGIKTQRGKSWSNGSVHSVLKRKFQRDSRYLNQRSTIYPDQLSLFKLETITFD